MTWSCTICGSPWTRSRGGRCAAGRDSAAGALIPDEVLDRFAFSGTPSHVAGLARRVLEAGAGRVDFGAPHGLTDEDGVALLGTAVLPRLRCRAGARGVAGG